MSWLVFALMTYLLTALQEGLSPLWSIPVGRAAEAAPSLLLVLLCFVSLLATGATSLWVALLLGLIADALSGTPIVGPHALGFMLGSYVVLQLRALVFRESVFTLAFMTLAAGLFAHLAAVALLAIRGLPISPAEVTPGFAAADQLVTRFFDVLYSAVVAIPLGWLLFKTAPLWRFPSKARGERVY
ncbi:MAG: rod shape-determining protein MreD [Phycisphaeraceae bacterium]